MGNVGLMIRINGFQITKKLNRTFLLIARFMKKAQAYLLYIIIILLIILLVILLIKRLSGEA